MTAREFQNPKNMLQLLIIQMTVEFTEHGLFCRGMENHCHSSTKNATSMSILFSSCSESILNDLIG